MPLVRISLLEEKLPAQIKKIADAVHAAMVETISVPPKDGSKSSPNILLRI